MKQLNMMSSADSIKAQGVSSAYNELLSLVEKYLDDYTLTINKVFPADITHYHTINFEYIFTLPIAKLRGYTVGYVHFLPETLEGSIKLPSIFRIPLYKYILFFYRSMDHLVTVNPYFIDKLVSLGFRRDKISYIPNFVSTDSFFEISDQEKIKIKQKYNIPTDKKIILSVGQIQHRKGVVEFIETAKKSPDKFFIWAGGFSFGKISDGYNELKDLTEKKYENIKFLGIIERNQMNHIYNICDLFFMPSHNELFPMSILEAVSCGKPLLLRNLDCYKHILFDNYLKGDTVQSFADTINSIFNDKHIYNLYKKKAAEIKVFYSKENIAELWKKFYSKITEPKLKPLTKYSKKLSYKKR